ncbi:DsbA family protein [Aquisalimonas asiatica]|uniref:2-hydroxychromene-2-carboxylate isomerase n=1 Tax=Aquisalimonas asiatica TaxID=406100 RepID=A0A1H8RQ44_9GAMM|nr:DsbA family protein [Aquisalimonas asiatica]SEO68500.1 2-hydroxychromene-2-carboxylate isomerase [Aquisalimonas asiatica]
MAQLEWFFDVICPQAHIGIARMETLARQTGHDLVLRPVSLARLYEAQGLPLQPEADWAANKRLRLDRDLLRQAELAGLRLRGDLRRPVRESEAAQRLLAGTPPAQRSGPMHALFNAAWERGKPLDDAGLLRRIAEEHGLDPALIDADASASALAANTDEALSRGVFGVPTTMLGDQLWWGADRLDFVARALGGSAATAPRQPDGHRRRLEVFHDFSSPFSYLACTQVTQLAREHDAELVWRPMLLGALFKSIGTPMMPIRAMSENRQAWGLRDMQQWAAHRDVPFRFTSHFPLNTVLALRVSAVEPDLIQPLYRAAWAEDRNLSEQETVAAIVREAGMDPEDVFARATADETKALIKTNTQQAEAMGACGAPTLVVDGRLVFWGQDRLDMVARALDGWVPAVDGDAHGR